MAINTQPLFARRIDLTPRAASCVKRHQVIANGARLARIAPRELPTQLSRESSRAVQLWAVTGLAPDADMEQPELSRLTKATSARQPRSGLPARCPPRQRSARHSETPRQPILSMTALRSASRVAANASEAILVRPSASTTAAASSTATNILLLASTTRRRLWRDRRCKVPEHSLLPKTVHLADTTLKSGGSIIVGSRSHVP